MQISFLDTLDKKSLDTMKSFGHVFINRYTGQTRMKVYKPRNTGNSSSQEKIYANFNNRSNRSGAKA